MTSITCPPSGGMGNEALSPLAIEKAERRWPAGQDIGVKAPRDRSSGRLVTVPPVLPRRTPQAFSKVPFEALRRGDCIAAGTSSFSDVGLGRPPSAA